ncbi:methyltransferase domain-containing protein [Candidatus Woesearchaeota archaeon]|nr:MAG: methyltransferase domain-containing protein [Candidatus Woesearchaeota archaeon]
MKLLFYLSGENLELAKEEVLALTHMKKYKQYGRVVLLNTKKFDFSRLAFTKKVLKLVFVSSEKELEKNVKRVNWQRNYKKDYCVRAHGLDEKKLADLIWYKLKEPKVNLKNPKTLFEFFKVEKRVVCGQLIEVTGKGFKQRRPDLRPGFHPSSMVPKLARACVNLSSIKPKQKMYDPFCGTGGMMIEAGLIGCKVVGSDLSENMLKKAKLNLDHFNIKNYKLFKADATKTNVKCDAIVTDPPYGKASALFKTDRVELYENFLKNAYNFMKNGSKLVMVLPNTIKFKTPFKKIKTIDYYVHHSMTRRIYIMVK